MKIVVASNWGKLRFSPYFLSFLQYGFIVPIKTYKKYKNPSKDDKCFSVSNDPQLKCPFKGEGISTSQYFQTVKYTLQPGKYKNQILYDSCE